MKLSYERAELVASVHRRSHRVTGRLCRGCSSRRALYRCAAWSSRVSRDRDHDLCFQCYRATRNRLRSVQLRGGVA